MNIKAQCCGLALLFILLYYYHKQKKLQLGSGKAFTIIVDATIFGVFLDAFSIYAIANPFGWDIITVKAICKAYLCSIVAISLSAFLYTVLDAYSDNVRLLKKVNLGYGIFSLVGILLIIALPIEIYNGNISENVYTLGPSVYACYIFSFVLLISTLFFIATKKGKMNPHRREAVMFWMLLWIGASAVQFFFNQLLLVGYAASLGCMILYLKLENPEVFIDRTNGLFNQNALFQYLRQCFDSKEEKTLVGLTLLHSTVSNVRGEVPPSISNEIALYLISLTNVTVFENGDNEFVLVLDDPQQTKTIIETISDRFDEGWGETGSIHVQENYSIIPDILIVPNMEDFLALLRYGRTHAAEYLNGNVYVIGPEILAAKKRELEIERLILDAMENDWVEVFYQPIYSTYHNKFTSAEALVRIRDDEGNLVSPVRFIPIAEQNGMIMRLGNIVFDKVCAFLAEHNPDDLGIEYIEVNLSVVQCGNEQLAADYIAIMKKYDIKPRWINLEITESASLDAKEILLANMKKLMTFGVRFSLDDFGTGQSNLNYIIDMPVDIVKFDREMTNAYFENGKARYVMEAAMHMIQGLDLRIVSEGVETKEQLDMMNKLGIDYIQGFYYSKPIPQDKYLAFIKEKNFS